VGVEEFPLGVGGCCQEREGKEDSAAHGGKFSAACRAG
jgi:hypothetical protein